MCNNPSNLKVALKVWKYKIENIIHEKSSSALIKKKREQKCKYNNLLAHMYNRES